MIPERARDRIASQPIGRPLVLVTDGREHGMCVIRREPGDHLTAASWRSWDTAQADARALASEPYAAEAWP